MGMSEVVMLVMIEAPAVLMVVQLTRLVLLRNSTSLLAHPQIYSHLEQALHVCVHGWAECCSKLAFFALPF